MKIYIGEIVDNELNLLVEDDICPSKMREQLSGLQDGEEIELEITSPGGSVIAGNAIISQLREAQANGHKVVAKVHGMAVSMGSVIACAADELIMDESAVMMIHQPWTMVCGNQNDLRKEANTLELLSKTLVSIYKTKFPTKSEDEIVAMMDAETWILATEAEQYGLVCTVDHAASEPVLIAAKMGKYFKSFKRIPEALKMKNKDELPIEEEKEKETTEEQMVEEPSTEETKTEEKEEKEEEKVEEPLDEQEEETEVEELKKKIEELTKENEELKSKLAECQKEEKAESAEMVTKDECEKRVSGMQASMQKQINDFKGQLEQKDKELIQAKAEITSLAQRLEDSNRELQETASALEEKTTALDKLNANVNAKAEEIPTMQEGLAKCASPAEKVAFLKSGKYTK